MPFNLGFTEMVVIFIVALLVVGPRKLPELGKTLGKGLREFRKATEDLKSNWEEQIKEAEHSVDDVKASINEVKTELEAAAGFDEVKTELEAAAGFDEVKTELQAAASFDEPAPEAVPAPFPPAEAAPSTQEVKPEDAHSN